MKQTVGFGLLILENMLGLLNNSLEISKTLDLKLIGMNFWNNSVIVFY